MTVVNPKSISGINSITTGSGSDNLLTIHTSDASSTERVRINSSGDVIVGSGITVSPDGDIFATGVTTSTTFVGALTGNVTGNVTGTASGNAVLTGSTNNQLVTVTGSNAITGESNLLFDGTDTLEIGTAAGGSGYDSNMKLRIGRTSDAQICVRNTSGDTNYGGLIFGDQSSSFGGGIQYHHNGDSMRFYTAGSTEKVRIDSSGDLGINNTSPSAKLDVVDDSASGYIAEFRQGNTSNSGQIAIDSPTDSDARPVLIDMQRAGTTKWSIGQGYNSSGGAFHIATSSLAGGVTGVKASFLAGGGLTFNGDTAAANALDDYEEGTVSLKLRGNTTSTGELICDNGTYTKIGRMVIIKAQWVNRNASNLPTNQTISMTNIPFTPDGRHITSNLMMYKVTFDTGGAQYFFTNSSGFVGYQSASNAAWAGWNTNNWRVSDLYFDFTAVYETAT